MNRGLTYLTLLTPSPETSAQFYESVFHWKRTREAHGVCFFALPNVTLALAPADEIARFCEVEGESLRGVGALFSWNVETQAAVEDLVHRACHAGATVQRDAAALPWGGYAGVIQTPDGHLWEIVWNPKSN